MGTSIRRGHRSKGIDNHIGLSHNKIDILLFYYFYMFFKNKSK